MKLERTIEILEGYKAAKVLELMRWYEELLKDENISYEQLMQALDYDNKVLKDKKFQENYAYNYPLDGCYIARTIEDAEYTAHTLRSINTVLNEYSDYELHKKALELANEENKEKQNKIIETEIKKCLKNTILD